MSQYVTELEHSRVVKHFLNELDLGIRAANQEIIHGRIPDLDREKALIFATMVARLRADYLDAAFKHCTLGTNVAFANVEDLRNKRETYEEARDAFQALRHAIECGYIDIAQIGKGPGKSG